VGAWHRLLWNGWTHRLGRFDFVVARPPRVLVCGGMGALRSGATIILLLRDRSTWMDPSPSGPHAGTNTTKTHASSAGRTGGRPALIRAIRGVIAHLSSTETRPRASPHRRRPRRRSTGHRG